MFLCEYKVLQASSTTCGFCLCVCVSIYIYIYLKGIVADKDKFECLFVFHDDSFFILLLLLLL